MTLTLDLEALGNNDGHVLIPTFPGNGQPYSVTLGWTGKTPSGDIPLTLPPQNVSNPTSEQATFVIPNAHLKSIAGGSAAVRYTLVQNGVPANRESETTNVTVTSLPARLTEPVVVEASNGQIAPMQVLNGAHVRISYPGALSTDVVILIWDGKADAVLPQNGASIITFTVPPAAIAPLLGTAMDVQYAVQRGATLLTSPMLVLTVLPLMEGDFNMPKVTQATEGSIGVLDLSTFEGDAEIVIEPWPFIKDGQTVWLDMVSNVETLPILSAYPVTLAEMATGVSRPVSRAKLDLIADQSEIQFPAKVQFAGGGSAVGATSFPLLKLKLVHQGNGGGPWIEDFQTYESGPKPSPFTTQHMTFIGENISIVINQISDRYLQKELTKSFPTLNIELDTTYRRADIRLGISGSLGALLRCTYEDGKVEELVIQGTGWLNRTFEHDGISHLSATTIDEDHSILLHITEIQLYK